MEKVNRFLVILVVALFITISIGYAVLSTSLSINGASSINDATWDIHFENLQVTSGSVTGDSVVHAATLDTNRTTVTYELVLSTPGDYYEFTVDTKNDGTISGMIDSIESKVNNQYISTLPSYLSYSISYSDGMPLLANQQLNAGASETVRVRIEYKKDITASELPSEDQDLAFTFTINYVQKRSTAVPVSHPVSFATDSWDTIVTALRVGYTSLYHVGDLKEIEVGEYGTHTLRISNMSTPDECNTPGYSTSACGFVLEFADVVTAHNVKRNNSSTVGGWPESEGRRFVNDEIYNALPSDLRNIIIDSYVVSESRFDESGCFSTDKIYLLSECETFNACRTVENLYDRQLDYYSETGALEMYGSTSPVKYYNGVVDTWSLRSINRYYRAGHSDSEYIYVWETGCWGNDVSSSDRISPAFRIG